MQKSAALIIGVFFVVGLLVLGLSIKSGFQSQPQEFEKPEAIIAVSGSASKVISANGVSWSFEIVSSANTLNKVLEKSAKDKETLKQFFVNAGVSEKDIIFSNLQIIDAKNSNEAYYGAQGSNFIAEQSVLIQVYDINSLKNAQSNLSELYKAGVALKYQYKNDYLQIKYFYDTDYGQELIDEAFANAEAAAQKIAEKSNKTLSGLDNIYVDNIDYDYSNEYLPIKQITVKVNASFLAK
ncbi:MAG: SIMPL domain-containing protein [Campylobacteraceae bacterium]|jgi:hypothetical protein|nr:SIMPL domain-containing protein [Campylobacteraceae bacterium]